MVALGFENIVVFIFRLPSGTTCGYNLGHIISPQIVASDEGIAVNHGAIGCTGDRKFAPINCERGLGIPSGDAVNIAIVVNFLVATIPGGRLQGLHLPIGFQVVQPVI